MPYSVFRFLFCSGLLCMLAPAQNLPTRLQECEGNQCTPGGGGGAVWTFNGKQGEARWRYGAVAKLTIERYDSDGVTILRTDIGGTSPGLTAKYTGKMTRNRIDGNVAWTWPGHWNNKTASGTWYATVVEPPASSSLPDPDVQCTPQFPGTGAEAMARAKLAFEAKNQASALCWLRTGANKGDADAQGALATMLYTGMGIPVDYPQALIWAKKAAEQGNYIGERCLSLMYANGRGVAADAKQAEYWNLKAQKDR